MTREEFQKRFTYNPDTDRLGEGGFGEVFKTYDTVRDRWVAIKVSKVKPELESVRLRKEVEMVNHLPEHPNVAFYEACYTFREMSGEYDFGILQYYNEGNLNHLLNNNSLSLLQKQSLLSQILDGLEFLHEHGIIHRDLKPQNILIVKRQNGEYVPKITDFGISKQLDINNSSFFSNSLAGAGTLAYASPEQLRGSEIRKNTDLWSFGVIAFQVFTGQLPFTTGEHASTSEAGRTELFRQINSGKLPSESNNIPEPWKMLIRRCLIIDPAQRIKSEQEAKEILAGQGRNEAGSVFTKRDDETRIEMSVPKEHLSFLPENDRTRIESQAKQKDVSQPKEHAPFLPKNDRANIESHTNPQDSEPDNQSNKRYFLIAAIAVVIVLLLFFGWRSFYHSDSNDVKLNGNLPDSVVTVSQIDSAASFVQPQPELWVIKYDSLLNRAQSEFKKEQYDKAKTIYNSALRLIPKTDTSDKRKIIKDKIAECDKMIIQLQQKKEIVAPSVVVQEQPTQYRLTLVALNACSGAIVSGGGTFNAGTRVTATASTPTGCRFVNWIENGTPVSTNPNYTFLLNGNRTLLASYEIPVAVPQVVEPVKPSLEPVFFRIDKSIIDPDQEYKVKNAADFLKSNSNAKLNIIGYANKGSSSKYNMSLAQRRVAAVAKEMVEKYGISSGRLILDWKGDDVQPFAIEEKNNVVMFSE